MIGDYAKRLLTSAFKDFHVRTDVWYASTSVVVSATTGPNNVPIGNLTPIEIAWYVTAFMIAWALLRLLVLAPYRLWSEVTGEKAALEELIASEEFQSSCAMREYRSKLRQEMSQKFSSLLSTIQVAFVKKNIEPVHSVPEEMRVIHQITLQLGDAGLDEEFNKLAEYMAGLGSSKEVDFEEALGVVGSHGKAILDKIHVRKSTEFTPMDSKH